MQFARRADVPAVAHYGEYRQSLREDFSGHCAYCTGHEDEMGGEDHFEIDHHRPVSKFPQLQNSYSNLYYCCHGCNRRGAKGENWPSDEEFAAGYRFFDPVQENGYLVHMRVTRAGRLIKKTNVGEYSIQILRLNRDGLVALRKRRREMRILLMGEMKRLLRTYEQLLNARQQPSQEIVSRLQLIDEHLKKRIILSLLPNWWNKHKV